MLERAAGCLESAGQCFLRNSNGVIRSRKSLHPGFWRYRDWDLDFRLWYFILLHASGQSRSRSLRGVGKSRLADDDTARPFLDFLYTPKSQSFASSWVARARNGLLLRRKRRSTPDLARSYVSEASHSASGRAKVRHGFKDDWNEATTRGDTGQHSHEKEICLRGLLDATDRQNYDKVWELWMDIAEAPRLRSRVLEYLATSTRPADWHRAQRLFHTIPLEERSAKDYLHVTTCLLRDGKSSDVKRVCAEAMGKTTRIPAWSLGKNLAIPAWSVALASFIETTQWADALDLWDLRPAGLEYNLSHEALSQVWSLSDLPHRVLLLAQFLKERGEASRDSGAAELAPFLLKMIFTSADIVRDMTTETILILTQAFRELGCLTAQHYYNALDILQSFEVRSNVVRSIVVYRNFRWHLSHEIPPEELLESLLKTFTSLETTHGVQYLLDEYTLFYGKPSVEAYKHALTAFSRAGDAINVQRTFNKLLAEHGLPVNGQLKRRPRTQRWITPLLHVHAIVGNVEETLKQFKRISEFGFPKPSIVCWNILLAAYANAQDVDGALKVWERILDAGNKPDSYTFGTLMGLFANRGDIDAVRHMFQVARENRVQITTAMLDTIVEVYCANHRLDDAEEVAEACLLLDLEGSRTRMWNMLLWSYAFRADLDAVSRIHSRMTAAGVPPDGMTYAALMLALALIGQPDSARRILRTLHRSRRVHATEFHYTIILYAYVRARNRDMVHIIYQEIEERFRNPGLSARLQMLKSYLERDSQLAMENGSRHTSDVHLTMSEEFLIKSITEFDFRDFASKQPRPGTANQSLREAFPALYYEYLITTYGTLGASGKVEELFDEYMREGRLASPNDQKNGPPPLGLLAALMYAHLRVGQYGKVEECWKRALPLAVQLASRPNIEALRLPDQPPATEVEPPQHTLPQSVRSSRPLVVTERRVKSGGEATSILPSQRFILSRCLSSYLQALGYHNQHSKIPEVVSEFQKLGFSLTTHNWTAYVQALAGSGKVSDQLEAFVTFEKKFMPNFPGWNRLRRGFGVRPEGAPETITYLDNPKRGRYRDSLGKAGKRLWSKINPEFLQPTYVTLIYLAAALIDFRERSIIDGGVQLKDLFLVAPKTIQAIGDMPHLREKFQGVLLRRQVEQGDREMKPQEKFVWTGGILGVGGEQRTITDPVKDELSLEEESSDHMDTSSSEQDESLVADASADLLAEIPPRTLDYQDEQDIEAETLLELRRRLLGIDPISENEPEEDEKRGMPAKVDHSDILAGLPLNRPASSKACIQSMKARGTDSNHDSPSHDAIKTNEGEGMQ
jgi:pentatricopeptide repeat-containing protein PET309